MRGQTEKLAKKREVDNKIARLQADLDSELVAQ